jgi:hypothetical protein
LARNETASADPQDFAFTDRPVGDGLAVYTGTFVGDALHLSSTSTTEVQLG